MGLDINLFREEKGGNPDMVRESVLKRNPNNKDSVKIVDEIIEADSTWRKKQFETEQLKKDLNKLQKDIGKRMKASKGQDKCEVPFIANFRTLLPKRQIWTTRLPTALRSPKKPKF